MAGRIKLEIEAGLCRDCEACVLACSLLHEGASNPELSRVKVFKDMESYRFTIHICQQCEDDPECIQACPNEAIWLNDEGIVVIDQEECIQCGACAEACPYSAIFFNQDAGLYYKCDLCASLERLPACAEICPVDALAIRYEPLSQEA